MKYDIDLDNLRKEYLDDLTPKSALCQKYNMTSSQLNNYLFYHGMTKHGFYKAGISKEQLLDLYNDKTKSNLDICRELQCCEPTLRILLKHYEIKNRYDYSIYESDVCRMYSDGQSTTQIALALGIPKSRVRTILLKYNIERRDRSAAQRALLQDGTYDQTVWREYPFNLFKRCRRYFGNHIAKLVKDRDGWKCSICGSAIKLHVHHIYPFAQIVFDIVRENKHLDLIIDEDALYQIIINDPRFLSLDNMVTVCHSCHYKKFHPDLDYFKTISSQASIEEGSTTIESTAKMLVNE